MPKINRIFYATDLSPNAEYAFRYAVSLALKHDARIIILHVIESVPAAVYAQLGCYVADEQVNTIFKKRLNDALVYVKKRIEAFSEKELTDNPESADCVQSIEICEGFPAEEILTKANELDCDLIVMGTHSKGFLKNTFVGSVAKRVHRRTRKPVVIVPLPSGETHITFSNDQS